MKSEYKGGVWSRGSAFGKGEAEDANAYLLCFQQFQSSFSSTMLSEPAMSFCR